MLLDRVTESARHTIDRTLETRVGEGFDLAAVAADEVMMVVATCSGRFEARDAVTGVDTLHEPQLDQRLESPVHGSDADGPARTTELVVDLLRAQAAVLPPQQLDDGPACTAAAITGDGERVEGSFCPGVLFWCHEI